MSTAPLRGLRRPAAVVAAVLVAGSVAAPAAYADGSSDLAVTASVDASTHLIGKPFPITVTVTNQTDHQLTKLSLWDEHLSGSYLTVEDWAGAATTGPNDPGFALDAGATRTFTLTAAVWNWNQDVPHEAFHGPFADPAPLTVPVVDPTTTKGSASGVVYGDRNGNQTYDAGEGLAGASVTLSATVGASYQLVTDADGRFSAADVPAQRYNVYVHDLPGGWVLASSAGVLADVDGTVPAQAQVRAVRPLSEQLVATGRFDRQVYRPGDPVHVTVTLKNTGRTPLPDIEAGCDRFGGEDHLVGWQSWTDLAYPAKVSLAPGQSRTFTETGTVPAAAPHYGGFYLACDFGPADGPIEGYPKVDLYGSVPAPLAGARGVVYHDDNGNSTVDPGEAVPGTTVKLVDMVDGVVAATVKTDATGHFSTGLMRAGWYRLRVAGWTVIDDGPSAVGTCGLCGEETTVAVKH